MNVEATRNQTDRQKSASAIRPSDGWPDPKSVTDMPHIIPNCRNTSTSRREPSSRILPADYSRH